METKKAKPKDVFLHLASMIALYVSAGALITLLFQYINLWIPDILQGNYRTGVYHTIRGALAALIVMFPTYVVTSWLLERVYRTEPEARNLRIRKWLIYFTMFVAGLALLGDVISLIYYFLEGEVTLRFFLKVFSIFFVAGSIFTYYLWMVKKYKTE